MRVPLGINRRAKTPRPWIGEQRTAKRLCNFFLLRELAMAL
jgi:hypothetical protein